MTLNASGVISIGGSTSGQSINLELGRAATATSSLGESALRTLAGVASGTISMSNFYGKSNFTPTTRVYTTVGIGFVETIPTGATTMVIEIWGPGGYGGAGWEGYINEFTYESDGGGGGGAGGYSRSSYNVSGQGGNTINFNVGSHVVNTGSQASSGTFTISTMSAGKGYNGYQANFANPGQGNTGGLASGGNVANTTGASGLPGNGEYTAPGYYTQSGGAGGAGTTGVNGGPYGAGGTGMPMGTNPGNGAVIFRYT